MKFGEVFVIMGFILIFLIAKTTMTQVYSAHPVETVKILVGPKEYPECQAEIDSSVLQQLNDLGLWKWIAGCVESKETEK